MFSNLDLLYVTQRPLLGIALAVLRVPANLRCDKILSHVSVGGLETHGIPNCMYAALSRDGPARKSLDTDSGKQPLPMTGHDGVGNGAAAASFTQESHQTLRGRVFEAGYRSGRLFFCPFSADQVKVKQGKSGLTAHRTKQG